jgi:hypothetical protein
MQMYSVLYRRKYVISDKIPSRMNKGKGIVYRYIGRLLVYGNPIANLHSDRHHGRLYHLIETDINKMHHCRCVHPEK